MCARESRAIALFLLASGLTALACDLGTLIGGSPKPMIVIQSPAPGSQFSEDEEIAIQSVVTDYAGIVGVDLVVDGVTARTDKPPPGQSTLVSLTQKWKATAGAHTLGVRAHNASGAASDLVTVPIVVVPTIARLHSPTSLPIQITSTPPATLPAHTSVIRISPSPTIPMTATPILSPVTITFDSGVMPEQKEAIQNGFGFARQYLGDVGPVSVFAYASLNTLINESSRYFNRAPDSAVSKNIKQHLENHIWLAYAEANTVWIWVTDFWKSAPLKFRYQLIAHEYFHLLQKYLSQKGFADQAPLWLSEGSAEYAGYLVVANAGLADLQRVSKQKAERTRGILNPLSTMETLRGAEVEDTETPYSLGYVAAEFLASSYGNQALLEKYWQARATAPTWQAAFQTAFGISASEYYQKFEAYRRVQFPPYCGTVGEAGSVPFSVKFYRQFPAGAISFEDLPFTLAKPSPNDLAYVFCAKGFALASLPYSQFTNALKYPKEHAKLESCGGSCWILYMSPGAPAGTYTFAIQLPDGRKSEAAFQHGAAIATGPSRVPATPTLPVPPGIYVTHVRTDPPEPKNGQYPTFHVTFLNTLGFTAYYNWYVKIYEPDKKNSLGETAKVDAALTPGSSTHASATNWKALGTTPCRQYIARVFYLAPDKTILEFPKPGGDNYWHYFSVCQ